MAAETITENYLNLWRSIDLNVENYKLFFYFFYNHWPNLLIWNCQKKKWIKLQNLICIIIVSILHYISVKCYCSLSSFIDIDSSVCVIYQKSLVIVQGFTCTFAADADMAQGKK